MKKLIIIGFTTAVLSATLTGCGWWGNTWDTAETGLVGAGSDVVAAGGEVVDTGVDVLVGRPVTRADMIVWRRHGVIHRHGHTYRVVSGRYVMIR